MAIAMASAAAAAPAVLLLESTQKKEGIVNGHGQDHRNQEGRRENAYWHQVGDKALHDQHRTCDGS